MNVTEPNSAMPTTKPIRLHSTKVRWRNSASGMIGSAASRSSYTKPPIATAPSASIIHSCGDDHGSSEPPSLVNRTMQVRAVARNAAPM